MGSEEIRREELLDSYQGGPDFIVEYRDDKYVLRDEGDSPMILGKVTKEPYVENGEEVVNLKPAKDNVEEEFKSILEERNLAEIGDLAAFEARLNQDSNYEAP